MPLPKTDVPRVSFRGESADLKLTRTISAKLFCNRWLQKAGMPYRLNVWYPTGYYKRREAMVSCLKRGGRMHTDFLLNPPAYTEALKAAYLQSFRENTYFICASGHGNYSYRFYETLREGRIPVYIHTRDVLPCTDAVDWRKHVIWIEADEAHRAADYILDFHAQTHPDDFMQRQIDNRKLYGKYCTMEGFSAYLVHRFLPAYS